MISWRQLFLILFLYRCGLSVAGEKVVRSFTNLGDAGQFQKATFYFGNDLFVDSNRIAENIGAVFHKLFLGNPILINIGFQALAFVGLLKLMNAMEPEIRKQLAFLLFLPSFNLWSSVAGKEAVIVFALGVLCAYVVDMYYGKSRLKLIHLFCVYLLFMFKPHYLLALGFVFAVTKISGVVRQQAFVALLLGTGSLLPLYYFRERISELSFAILPHFIGFGRSTRVAFWVEPYDVFWKAPYGMWQGFLGPTFSEALAGQNLLHVVSFVESAILVGAILFFVVRRLPELPVYSVVVAAFATFWMLFPNYPFGIMNPGSAIRYRTGYVVFIFMIFTLLMSRDVYLSWRRRVPRRGESQGVASSALARRSSTNLFSADTGY